jgi:hypothetical protein
MTCSLTRLRALSAGRVTADRRVESDVTLQTRDEWRRAYERRPPTARERAVLLLVELLPETVAAGEEPDGYPDSPTRRVRCFPVDDADAVPVGDHCSPATRSASAVAKTPGSPGASGELSACCVSSERVIDSPGPKLNVHCCVVTGTLSRPLRRVTVTKNRALESDREKRVHLPERLEDLERPLGDGSTP